ncbi:MAG TPA: gas vesicle protein [Gemmatimonadaceae bacterium]
MTDAHLEPGDEDALVLSDLLSHVLDKGVVITGDVIISIAGIDLIAVSLSVLISALETLERKRVGISGRLPRVLGDLPVLRSPGDA